MSEEKIKLLIITGLSGSGKTQASRYLEDIGYFCVDNLPPIFIPKFAELCAHSGGQIGKVVLVVDMRSQQFFATFVQVLEEMQNNGQPYDLLFMDASDAVIIRRYKETRRRHPLAPSSRISEGIQKEREQLERVRKLATHVIDTTELKKNELKSKILNLFAKRENENMGISVLSFGFKFGIPMDADIVLDVRFLPNPFYVDNLKHKSGMVAEVAEYIARNPVTKEFEDRLDGMMNFLIPQYQNEGKTQLVIAIGCTGGMHRSVYIAKHIYDFLSVRGHKVMLEHRDLMKNDVHV